MKLIELIYDKEKYREKIKENIVSEIETIFKVNGMLLGGGCLKSEGGIYGDDCDLYGFFQDILEGLAFLLDEGKHTRELYYRKNVEHIVGWNRFKVKNFDLAYGTSLFFRYNDYIFELDKDKDELIIHYRNDPLSYTDCEKYKGKERGIVRVPLKDFTKEIVKLAEEYLELLRNSEIPEGYDFYIDDLQEYLNDVKKYYKERYGEEL